MPLTNPYNPYQPYTAGLPYYPQMPNPYQTQPPMPKLDNIGQTQQAPNTSQSIFGHVVSNESEIKPNEVPMDGSIALFPLSDFTSIIAKQWSQDGTIKTLKFIPDVVKESKDNSNDSHATTTDDLAYLIDSGFTEIKSLLSSVSKTKTTKGDTKGDTNA